MRFLLLQMQVDKALASLLTRLIGHILVVGNHRSQLLLPMLISPPRVFQLRLFFQAQLEFRLKELEPPVYEKHP